MPSGPAAAALAEGPDSEPGFGAPGAVDLMTAAEAAANTGAETATDTAAELAAEAEAEAQPVAIIAAAPANKGAGRDAAAAVL
jgi:hypothetical protein